MVEEIPITNLGLIAVSIAILLYQYERFHKSEKPIRQYAPRIYNIHTPDDEGRNRYKQDDKKYRKIFIIDTIVYYIIFFIPISITILSIIFFFNLSISISLLVSAGVSTGIMEYIYKNLDEKRKQVGML